MPNIMEELEKALTEHEDVLKTVSAFMASHAEAKENAPSPLRLQALLEKLRSHTALMSELLIKFPIVSG